jgi:hypothetical protein
VNGSLGITVAPLWPWGDLAGPSLAVLPAPPVAWGYLPGIVRTPAGADVVFAAGVPPAGGIFAARLLCKH